MSPPPKLLREAGSEKKKAFAGVHSAKAFYLVNNRSV
jgi:hypothetical protein